MTAMESRMRLLKRAERAARNQYPLTQLAKDVMSVFNERAMRVSRRRAEAIAIGMMVQAAARTVK